jgi:pimeloyl-ACP methyl ester carboxylesterase
MAWQLDLAERFKPAWSWGIMVLALNGYAPIAAKVLAGFHGLAVLMTASSNGNHLHQRYLALPGMASAAALFVSWALGLSTTGSVAGAVVALHLASVAHEAVWRLTFPAPLITHMVDVRGLQARHRQSGRCELFSVTSTYKPEHQLSAARVRGTATGAPRVLLYLGGNGELWEHSLSGVANLARHVNADAVQVNFRGVGTSQGVTKRGSDMVEDAADVIAHLLRTTPGLTPRDIVIFGHSIGGAVAAHVVARHYPECGIVIDRSFSSLADAAHGLVGVPLALTRPVVSVVFGLMNSAKAFPHIPHNRKVVTYHRGDRVISYPRAALGRLPDFQRGGQYQDYTIELTGTVSDPHNCELKDLRGANEVVARIASFYRE